MNVYAPNTPGPHPAIVQIYGGAWQRGSPDNDAMFARYFAARGYVVFAIDYRHAPRWRWPAQLDDVRRALWWIRAARRRTTAPTCRASRSSADRRAPTSRCWLPTGPVTDHPVQAVVSLYGPTDLVRGYREPPRPDPMDVRAVLTKFMGGTPDELPDAYLRRVADHLRHAPAAADAPHLRRTRSHRLPALRRAACTNGCGPRAPRRCC